MPIWCTIKHFKLWDNLSRENKLMYQLSSEEKADQVLLQEATIYLALYLYRADLKWCIIFRFSEEEAGFILFCFSPFTTLCSWISVELVNIPFFLKAGILNVSDLLFSSFYIDNWFDYDLKKHGLSLYHLNCSFKRGKWNWYLFIWLFFNTRCILS